MPFETPPLLLTASVDPKGMPNVSRPDPKVREADYLAALRFYGSLPSVRRIVLAENSGWDLGAFAEIARGLAPRVDIELLSLPGNDYPRERGKSFGEMVLLERSTAASRLIAEAGRFVKVTGRLRLLNLERLLSRIAPDVDLAVDVRDHPIYRWLGLKLGSQYADTRMFVCSLPFFHAELDGKSAMLDDSAAREIEWLMFNTARAHLSDGRWRVSPRFAYEPDFQGFAGHAGKNYSGRKERLRRHVRGLGRRLVPWLWI